jgi:glycine/D-amino acid oxidase-like deaminating enzyme
VTVPLSVERPSLDLRDWHHLTVTDTADVIVIGAGVQGASLAFHLAQRGAQVLILERSAVAGAATGRSSGFVRMHYDLESESRLAWASLPYFRSWAELVGTGDPGFVRTGFLELVSAQLTDHLRANVAMHQRIGIPTRVVDPSEIAELFPGIQTDDIVVGAHEPESGYADPTSTATSFIAAAREHGARLVQGCRVDQVTVQGDRVDGVETNRGHFAGPAVVDVAGAWAAEIARTVGLEVPIQAWRHDTAYFGLPDGRGPDFPIVIDDVNEVYFRPEGRELMLVGLEVGNEIGGSPDRAFATQSMATADEMVDRVCRRVPWMARGTFRRAHGGQDGITPDQRAILGHAGPDGFYLACGFSGTGFKTAPAVGKCMAELILDGRASTVDISGYTLDRFAAGRPLVGEHPYEALWR